MTKCYKRSIRSHYPRHFLKFRVAIAAGDIIKYQGGHMMRNADVGTVRSHQEMFNSNGGHEA